MNWFIIKDHEFTVVHSIKMHKIKVREVRVIRDKLKTLHPYRPRALKTCVHPRTFNLAGISILVLVEMVVQDPGQNT